MTLAELGLLVFVLTRLNAKVKEFNGGRQLISQNMAGLLLVKQHDRGRRRGRTPSRARSKPFAGLTRARSRCATSPSTIPTHTTADGDLRRGPRGRARGRAPRASPRGRSPRLSAAREQASPRWWSSCRVCVTPRAGPSRSTASTSRSSMWARCARASATSRRARCCSTTRCARTSSTASTTSPPTSRSETPSRGHTRRSCTTFRTASRPSSATAACASPGASGSASRLRACSSRTARSSSSTSPPARSTRSRRRYIQKALARLHGTKTIIVIAHRLATVIQADQLLVIEDGRIVERGTHAELVDLRRRVPQALRDSVAGVALRRSTCASAGPRPAGRRSAFGCARQREARMPDASSWSGMGVRGECRASR